MMSFCVYGAAKGELQMDVFLMQYALSENLFSAFQSIPVDLIEPDKVCCPSGTSIILPIWFSGTAIPPISSPMGWPRRKRYLRPKI